MKNLCDSNNCPYGKSRETCTELCPEALAYANQDYIGYEKAFNIPGLKKLGEFKVPQTDEDKIKEIKILHKKGYSDEDISVQIECDLQFIDEVLEE